MARPRISLLRLWERHELRVINVLGEALAIMSSSGIRESNEVLQNRRLFQCLMEANNRQWRLGTGGFDHPPTPEGKNLPSADDEQRAMREDKIPDFQWTLIDHAEDDPVRSVHAFVIECKILGKPKRADWIYNENYVKHGMLRFVAGEHGYAKGEISGAMIGYVYDMDPGSILAEVNVTASTHGLPHVPHPDDGWQEGGTSRMTHMLVRTFPTTQFKLVHFWVDLRPTAPLAASTT